MVPTLATVCGTGLSQFVCENREVFVQTLYMMPSHVNVIEVLKWYWNNISNWSIDWWGSKNNRSCKRGYLNIIGIKDGKYGPASMYAPSWTFSIYLEKPVNWGFGFFVLWKQIWCVILFCCKAKRTLSWNRKLCPWWW